ncbi:MAG TPA: GIY-YIG nuclease family protein [Saprospiraceae bacterium]|nr:GIY-YIG nuclease family protein [Saprospiraceae bacterium]
MLKLRANVFLLSLADNKVQSIFDIENNVVVSKFSNPLTSKEFKIYIIKNENKILYIGTTKTSIITRLSYGLRANGKNGYHGYKWKTFGKVLLYVFCFNDFDKSKIESIEAELAFMTRESTGRWPECQNEIHFNNDFIPTGQLIAQHIFRQLHEQE